MDMKWGMRYLFAAMLILLFGIAHSDVLLLDSIADTPANNAQGIPRPTRGMSMQTVKSRFGEPSQVHPRIGNPPITRWDYPDYSVFFEYQHVLTSVVHR
jgi:hypothetical protein